MRIVEKLLYGIGGLLALVLLFILFCHFNPSISKEMGSILYAKENETEPETPVTLPIIPDDNGLTQMPESSLEYTAVPDSSLKIPSKVSALNGFLPFVGKGSGISKESAEEVENTLGVGETGEGLTFDKKFYPYYHMLNDSGQALYRQIYANANALNASFAPVVTSANSLINTAFSAVCCDHPELFWLDTSYKYTYGPNGKVVKVDLVFNSTITDLENNRIKFEKGANEIIYMTRGLIYEYDKEKRVHDELIDKVVYDLKAPMNQSAYSALVIGRTVCAGYSRAFQYIMQQLNIPCYYVCGYAGGNHAWNIIKLGNDYYNVDSTWDDTNPNTRDYFNCSDAEFASTHTRRDLSVYLPACKGTAYGSDIREAEEAKRQEEELKKAQEEDSKKEEDDNDTEQDTDTTSKTIVYSLEHYGFTEDDVLKSEDDYYRDCIEHLLATDKKTVTFRNIVDNEKLWEKINEAYDNGEYDQAYMKRVLAEKHLSRANINITAYLLADGTYLVEHTITMK